MAPKTFARKRRSGYRLRVSAKPTKKTEKAVEAEEPVEKVGLYLPAKLALALRVAAAQRRMRISEFTQKLLVEALECIDDVDAADKSRAEIRAGGVMLSHEAMLKRIGAKTGK
jgi:hypothetical protein